MKNKYIIFLVLSLFIAGACTDKFEDFNTDRKYPSETTSESLFTYAQLEMTDQVSSTNVNTNVFKLWAQYWNETTYTDETNYDIVTRTVPDYTFMYFYTYALKNFREASEVLAEETDVAAGATELSNADKQAIIDIHEVYTMIELIDCFGDVPYTEALNDDILAPVFDDAFTTYKTLAGMLKSAITTLSGEETHTEWDADLVYGGNPASWVKFAYGLLMKMGITIADYDASLAEEWIVLADGNTFTKSSEDALLVYETTYPNTNPLYEDLVLSGRSDFVGANTIVDIMNDLNDPRREQYFQTTTISYDTAISGTDTVITPIMGYLGGDYGYTSSYSLHSAPGECFNEASFPGILLTYNEILFYLAEAAARGMAVSKTVEEYYNEAVTESIAWWQGYDMDGVSDTLLSAEDYLAQDSVAYATAPGDWKQKIATQSWLASYSRGFIGWTTWRRLDYPVFNMPKNYSTEDQTSIPTRFTYPIYEQNLNAANYEAASTAIGGDELTTKLYWDKYDATVE